jgi:hypothetical protein
VHTNSIHACKKFFSTLQAFLDIMVMEKVSKKMNFHLKIKNQQLFSVIMALEEENYYKILFPLKQ